ncbi:calvin cycle protein CP12-3, chloroplastic-like [Syzygium oleosum]|uniref:calvin cycle protein CP12-3, chloroplastic-like n=1 Tax=Syzygium oleosum TaxID=219896 RepID=UPI0024B99AE6|nr:calvin cycle protein CP12-3, chloroplastic-like [Syzygium oleosum]
MASSSITPLSLSSPFSPTPILLSPSAVASLGVATRRQGKKPGAFATAAAVKAMGGGGGGGGKYKGTQMRERRLREMIEEKVAEAKEACEGEAAASAECRVAWDEVEEVSQAKAHLRLKLEVLHQDPLESFCGDNPETDECHVYDADDDDE